MLLDRTSTTEKTNIKVRATKYSQLFRTFLQTLKLSSAKLVEMLIQALVSLKKGRSLGSRQSSCVRRYGWGCNGESVWASQGSKPPFHRRPGHGELRKRMMKYKSWLWKRARNLANCSSPPPPLPPLSACSNPSSTIPPFCQYSGKFKHFPFRGYLCIAWKTWIQSSF